MSDLDSTLQSVDRLIARGGYPQAIDLLEQELATGRDSARLLQQLADLYVLTGAHRKAVALMLPLVDRFAADGFVTRAIAVLKKIENLAPGQQEIEEQLAELIQRQQGGVQGDSPGSRVPSGSTSKSEAVEAAFADEVAPIVHSPLFAGFSTRELVALIRGLGLSTFAAGEILVTEGESGNSLLILASGSVRVYVRDEEGRNHHIRTLQPPEFFGEVCLFDRTARTATVVAATSCELLRLDGVTLAMIGTKHPDLPQALQRAYTERAGSPEERQARRERKPPL